MTLQGLLRGHSFLTGLSDVQLDRLAALASEVTFQENELVLRDGERSTFFYLLIEGSVAVELRAANFSVCVEALVPGQVFGWSALLDHEDTFFQVRARELTRALRLSGEDLSEACREDTELGSEIHRRTLGVVASRLRATEKRFAEMCGVKT